MVTVIMPAFNEGGHIYDNISTTRRVLVEAGIEAEIVVVDDGSTDGTLSEIERAAADFGNVVPARNPYNMGKGMALRTGFDYSSGDIVVFLDADLDLHPSQITRIIEELDTGPYDVVVTSKHHPDSRLAYPRWRKAASFAYYMMIKALFGLPVRDTQTGLKVFRRDVLTRVFHRLLVKKFAYDVELLAAAVRFGFRVNEVPVALDFRRELKWGRIRLGDIFSIFVDTLAIFYRLRILRYYDIERPHAHREHRPVLVVVNGCPPPETVIRRLSIDSNTSIACITSSEHPSRDDVMFFGTVDRFDVWRESHGQRFDIIGFLGEGMLPNGSWVKNAVRNFEDSSIDAVCGPIVPGPFESRLGKAAGLVASSMLSTGTDCYLRTIRRVRHTRKGSMENAFFRAGCFDASATKPCGILFDHGHVFDTSKNGKRLLYDPDVAVSSPVPSLFTPYLRQAAADAYEAGKSLAHGRRGSYAWWRFMPTLLFAVLAAGWMFMPSVIHLTLAGIYAVVVIATGFACFDFLTAPLFMSGLVLEHLVQAVFFPAGIITGLFGGKT